MYDHILVATDGSPPAAAAVDRAVRLAASVDADLTAVSVVDTLAYGVADVRSGVAEDTLAEAADTTLESVVETAEAADVPVSTQVLHGSPAATITDFAGDNAVDLIVVGTHGRRGVSRVLLGSVAERITRIAQCSVLVVRETDE
ncbi:MAG: universal stress protein [Halobacteriaceae archaeon]